MIGIFSSIFKHRKLKQFGYKPLYYDAEKEAREKRTELIKKETGAEIFVYNEGYRKLLHEKWRKNYVVLANKKSNMRIIIIAALLAVICYLILKT